MLATKWSWERGGEGRGGEERGWEGRGGEGRGGEGRDGSATHIPAGDKPSVVVVPRTSCDKALAPSGSQLREAYLHVQVGNPRNVISYEC